MERESRVGVKDQCGAIRGPWGIHISEKLPKQNRRRLRMIALREERIEILSRVSLGEAITKVMIGKAPSTIATLRRLLPV